MNEHNPITIRLDEMVTVWKKNVQPHHTLIRWMLKPEDYRMYEGFCRLEASPHGKLDNLFVFFYTPFADVQTYSHALMKDWLQEYDDPKQRKLLEKGGIKNEWDLQVYRQAVNDNDYAACDALLPDMIRSYKNYINQAQTPFVFSVMPRQTVSAQQFIQWMFTWMQQPKPDDTQLLVFDHLNSNYWGNVFEQYADEAVTLQHDLRMQEAIRQIATAGAATDPYAFFRKCMFEMGDASLKKNKELLNQWGEKAVECGKKTTDKNLLATAYITWAGMLFTFKDHDRINELLDTGIRLCKQGVAAGNDPMKSLLLQYFIYKGADCQLQKERKEALQWYMKAGDEAVAFDFPGQAVSAYYKAYIFANHKNWNEEKMQACTKALQLTKRLSNEEIQASEYPFMAHVYWQEKQGRGDALLSAVEEKMVSTYGEDWTKIVDELKENYTKNKIRQAEAGEIAISETT
jgi:hypothetical protein